MTATRVTSDLVKRLLLVAEAAGTEAWLSDVHDREPVRVLTRSRSTDTSLVDVPGLGLAVRKRWRWEGLGERLKGVGRTTALARTPAEREWAALARRYGPAGTRFHPEPLAYRVERRGGLATRAMLLLEAVEGAVELAMFLRDEACPRARTSVLGDLALRTRAMHDDGVADGDFHPRNLLVAPRRDGGALRVWKVDCGRQRVHRAPLTERRATYDLACVDVGLARFATRTERVRALRAYVGEAATTDALRSRASEIRALRRAIEQDESRRLPRGPSE